MSLARIDQLNIQKEIFLRVYRNNFIHRLQIFQQRRKNKLYDSYPQHAMYRGEMSLFTTRAIVEYFKNSQYTVNCLPSIFPPKRSRQRFCYKTCFPQRLFIS